MEGIEIIRDSALLQKAFKFIIDNSKSNYLPYHNLNHLLTVLKYSDYIANGEGVYYDKRLSLHLAALFHDVNHSGGELHDDENIQLAKSAFVLFTIQEGIDITLAEEVRTLIEATEYPYVKPNSNTSQFEKIIRDADMMQQFEYNWIGQTTLGLASENKISIIDFIPKQRHFLESIIFLTKTANKFKKNNWIQTMNEFRVLEVSMNLK